MGACQLGIIRGLIRSNNFWFLGEANDWITRRKTPLDPGQELLVTNPTVALFLFWDTKNGVYMLEKLISISL